MTQEELAHIPASRKRPSPRSNATTGLATAAAMSPIAAALKFPISALFDGDVRVARCSCSRRDVADRLGVSVNTVARLAAPRRTDRSESRPCPEGRRPQLRRLPRTSRHRTTRARSPHPVRVHTRAPSDNQGADMALKFAKPGSGRGDRWEKNEHEDHLHAFVHPTDGGTHKFADHESDAVHVDFLICLDDHFVQADALVFGAALVPSLLAVDPDTIVVRAWGRGPRSRAGPHRGFCSTRPLRTKPTPRNGSTSTRRRRSSGSWLSSRPHRPGALTSRSDR